MGLALNGVLFRSNTAKYWDPKSSGGHTNKGDKKGGSIYLGAISLYWILIMAI
tara:strand:+ start:625 stop:783 length:159 start_codon:yes stop_codon:yes gene_type:complete